MQRVLAAVICIEANCGFYITLKVAEALIQCGETDTSPAASVVSLVRLQESKK